jgi:hypothetical protein
MKEIPLPPKVQILLEQQEHSLPSPSDGTNQDTIIETTEAKNPRETGRAIASVINFLLTDSFNLSEREHEWLGYQLGKIIKPLETLPAEIVLASVNKELETGEYSARLFNYRQNPEIPENLYGKTKTALLEDWVTVISSAILSSYPTAKPMIQAATVGQIYAVLSELGLTNSIETSRRSVYLPNAVRYLLNQKNI